MASLQPAIPGILFFATAAHKIFALLWVLWWDYIDGT
jgi:hypothetical protein